MSRRRRLSFGGFEFDPGVGELRRAGAVVALTPQSLALLSYLLDHRDRVVSRDELLAHVWDDVVVSDGALATAIYELRAVVGDRGQAQRTIGTVRGRGFRFIAPIEQVETDPRGDGAPGVAIAANAVFVGRSAMLDRLRRGLEAAADGQTRFVFLEGEAGIGKTSLARQLATTARGVSVHWGRCFEHAGAPPFWPWMQILREQVAFTSAAELRRLLGARVAELIGRLVDLDGSAAHAGAAVGAAEDRFHLFDAIGRLLRHAATREPLLLVIDDLHFGDPPSLVLLEFLATELLHSRIFLVATYRAEDVAEGHPLRSVLAALSRHPHCERYELRGLENPEVRELLASLTGEEPAQTVVDSVMVCTEGNPLFVQELARQTSLVAGDLTSLGQTSALPDTVEEIIGQRVARLSASTQDALAAAAVLGREFGVEATACTWDGAAPLPATWLEEAVRCHVVTVTDESRGLARFTHALFREVLYRRIEPRRRGELHARAGEALEGLRGTPHGADLAALSHHFTAALSGGGNAAKATGYALAASRFARDVLAYEEAVAHCTRALKALEWNGPPDSSMHAEVLLELAEARSLAGAAADARETFTRAAAAARRAGAATLLARAALGYAAAYEAVIRIDVHHGGQPERSLACALLAEALDAVGESDATLRARALASLAVHATDSSEAERMALSRDAQAIAERLDDNALRAEVAGAQREILWTPEHVDRRLELATALVRLAQRAGDRELELRGRAWALGDLLELGEAVRVRRELAACAQLAAELRQPKYDHHVAVLHATLAVLDGRLDEAERLATDAVMLGRRIRSWVAEVTYTAQMLTIRREQGRLAEMESMVRERLAGPLHPALRCAQTYFAAELGRLDEARDEFDRLAASGFAAVPRDRHWLGAMALLAIVCADLEDRERAAVLYELLLPFAGRNVVYGEGLISHGAVSHHLGELASVLGRWTEAEEHFHAALELNERLGARAFSGQIQRAFAQMLIARNAPGDVEEALRRIDVALEASIRHGAHGLHERLISLRSRARNRFAPESGDLPQPRP